MAKTIEPKQERTPKRIPPLPGGLIQHREGIERCGGCNIEVVSARRLDGTLIHVSVVFGREHACREPQKE